jgi:hypothetical protein
MVCFSQWCNGLCSLVVKPLHHWETQTITPPRNKNHYTTEEHKPLHHQWTETNTSQRTTNHYTTDEQKPLYHREVQTITPPRNRNHYTTEEQNPLHHRWTQTITNHRGTQTITPPIEINNYKCWEWSHHIIFQSVKIVQFVKKNRLIGQNELVLIMTCQGKLY